MRSARDREVEAFDAERHEVEAARTRDVERAGADVACARGDTTRDVTMALRDDARRRRARAETFARERAFEHASRAGIPFARDEANAAPSDVRGAANAERISSGHEQAHLPMRERDDGATRCGRAGVGDVLAEVKARDVDASLAERAERIGARAREPDVTRAAIDGAEPIAKRAERGRATHDEHVLPDGGFGSQERGAAAVERRVRGDVLLAIAEPMRNPALAQPSHRDTSATTRGHRHAALFVLSEERIHTRTEGPRQSKRDGDRRRGAPSLDLRATIAVRCPRAARARLARDRASRAERAPGSS